MCRIVTINLCNDENACNWKLGGLRPDILHTQPLSLLVHSADQNRSLRAPIRPIVSERDGLGLSISHWLLLAWRLLSPSLGWWATNLPSLQRNTTAAATTTTSHPLNVRSMFKRLGEIANVTLYVFIAMN